MTTVTQVKDGLWLVNFPEFQLDKYMNSDEFIQWKRIPVTNFQFNQMNYVADIVVLCFLGLSDDLRVQGHVHPRKTNDEHCSPQTISAICNGNLSKMVQSENGEWDPALWQFIPPANQFSIQFIIEFQHSCEQQHIPPHFAHLFDSRIMAYVKFLVKDEEIGAHLAIAVSASPVMAVMLEPDNEGLTRTVTIDDMEPDVFKEMLRYVYTGSVQNLEQNGEPLFVAADKYQIQGLKELCTEQLIRQLDLNNAVRYLVLGHLHSVPRLLESSLQTLENNKNGLWNRTDWKNLGQNYPDLFFQATGRLMK